jgi:23S rRNA pseudouridine1911/1915/1917 synthase
MTESLTGNLELKAPARDRLDRALAQSFPDISRARFQRLIAGSHVTVDGRSVSDAGFKVTPGQIVIVHMPEPTEAAPRPEALPLTILHEDSDFLVLDKPAGLIVHPGAGHATGTLVNALLAHCGDSLSGIGGVKRPGIVHRLDKDTSGLLVVAKTDRAHKGLSEQFAAHGRDGRLERCYLALVWGAPERASGTIAVSLGRSTANRTKIATTRGAGGREAITHYSVLERFGQPALLSLLELQLETGRTHQIRVHMAHLGQPLLGDKTYGAGYKSAASKLPPKAQIALKDLDRQALHAAVLGFEHPVTGRRMRFESRPPTDFARLLSALAPVKIK